jgi:hypothetical protein
MKTAVEWLVEQLTEVDYNCINKTFLKSNNSLAGYKMRELFEQAVEMEKEQRREDTNYGYSQGWKHCNQNNMPMIPELKQQEQ